MGQLELVGKTKVPLDGLGSAEHQRRRTLTRHERHHHPLVPQQPVDAFPLCPLQDRHLAAMENITVTSAHPAASQVLHAQHGDLVLARLQLCDQTGSDKVAQGNLGGFTQRRPSPTLEMALGMRESPPCARPLSSHQCLGNVAGDKHHRSGTSLHPSEHSPPSSP